MVSSTVERRHARHERQRRLRCAGVHGRAVPLKAADKEWAAECRDIAEEAQEVGAVLQKALHTFEHMKLKELVSDEGLYRMMVEKWGWSKDKEERKRKSPEIEVKWYFRGGMGAEAIKDLLEQLDLDDLANELRTIIRDGKGQKQPEGDQAAEGRRRVPAVARTAPSG